MDLRPNTKYYYISRQQNQNQRQSSNLNFGQGRGNGLQLAIQNKQNSGILYYQKSYFTRDQIEGINNHFTLKGMLSKAPKVLFGDNNVDNERSDNERRMYWGGQAQHCGKYDRSFCHGITTTWYKKDNNQNNNINPYFQGNQPSPQKDFVQFKHLIDKQFEPLIQHIADGHDVICPAPTQKDIQNNRGKYYDSQSGRLLFKHNIGTGTGNLSLKYLQYIQYKLDELASIASNVVHKNEPKTYGMKQSQSPFRGMIAGQASRRRNNRAIGISPQRRNQSTPWLPMDQTQNQSGLRDRSGIHINPKRRLVFDDEPMNDQVTHNQMAMMNINNNNNRQRAMQRSDLMQQRPSDGVGLHYQSPRLGAAQRRPQMQQDESMQPHFRGNNMMGSPRQQQSNMNGSPQRRNYDIPHYKSPNGKARDREEYNQLSTPEKNKRANRNRPDPSLWIDPSQYLQNGMQRNNNNGFVSLLYGMLAILLFIPRSIYQSLMVSNRPQDTMKTICIMACIFAMVTVVMYGELSQWFFGWIALAIVTGLAGNDCFWSNSNSNNMKSNFYNANLFENSSGMQANVMMNSPYHPNNIGQYQQTQWNVQR